MAFQTIADRITPTFMKSIGNRTDITDSVNEWFRDSYLEFAMGYPFEELEDTLLLITSPGIGEYDYDPTMRAIKTVSLNLNPTGDFTTDSWRRLWRRNIRNIDRYASGQTAPAVYCSYARQVVIRPLPDQGYPWRWRVWLKPQIETDIVSTELKVPDDWLEIIDYGAKMRAFADQLERDKANEIRILLYGDPKKKDAPGLIKQKMLLKQAEAEDDNYPIAPRVRRYSYTT